MVSLELPESLLLEVRASLKLFGGLSDLRKELAEEIESRGFTFHASAAPTPLGALWLARHRSGDALSEEALSSCAGALPLHVTRWPEPVRAALKDMGITTVAECLRLPRDGFARRVGKRYLEDLDKVLGRRPDLRQPIEAPESLSFKMELLDGTTSLPVFVDAVTRMTKQLAEELRIRQAQVGRMRLVFDHLRLAPTLYRLELLEASCDERRLLDLLCDKLERIGLPAPATAVSLSAGPLQPVSLRPGRLFKDAPESGDAESVVRLVERLRGRLGSRAVRGLTLAPEHRPERAWVEVFDDLHTAAASAPPPPVSPWAHLRPLWILPAPQRLLCTDSGPRYHGALRLHDGPERIESGWWDEQGASRDYFAAATESGEELWVYRDRVDRCWYLHGIFG